MEDAYKVAVVGAGPTGLVLGIELGMRGIPTILFDPRTSTTQYPKGGTNSARSMEHYRRYGFAAEFRKMGLPRDHPTDVAYFTRFAGHELHRVKMPSINEVLASEMPETPEPPHRASQFFLEPLLVDKLDSLPSVTLAFGHKVETIGESANDVTLGVVECASGKRQTCKVDYVVGCDGANSLVRASMGVDYDGVSGKVRKFFGGKMMAIYFRSPELRAILADRRAWQYWSYTSEQRCMMSDVDGKGAFFMHIQIPDDARPDEDDARAFIRSAAGRPIEPEILSVSFWIAGRALTSERMAKGRLAVVGDAAHIFTPTGGFGLNTGVDDAANLGWKLAARLQGWGGDDLIESYHTERHAIALRNTSAAAAIADRGAACPVDEHVTEPGPQGGASRRRTSEYLKDFAFMEFKTLGVQLGASYYGSGVVVPDGSPAPDDCPTRYVPSSRPGGRLPHSWLGPDRSTLDEVGTGLTLYSIGTTTDRSRWRQAADDIGVEIKFVDLSGPEHEKLFGRGLLLVRPDQHIAWRAPEAPEDIGALFRLVLGLRSDPTVGTGSQAKDKVNV